MWIALLLHISLESTPMRLYREDSRAARKDIYARTAVGRDADGNTCELMPELSSPPDSKTASVVASLQIKELYLSDLVGAGDGFKYLMISCDAINKNRAAAKMLFCRIP